MVEPMTREEDLAAKREGWALFDVDGAVTRIQRLDSPSDAEGCEDMPDEPVFASDEAAIAFVVEKAAAGSKLHLKALELHQELEIITEPLISGSVISITARIECGGCGLHFLVHMDPVHTPIEPWSNFDEAVDAVRGGNWDWHESAYKIYVPKKGNLPSSGSTSVQHGYLLCPICTAAVDDLVPGDEDRNATKQELEAALRKMKL